MPSFQKTYPQTPTFENALLVGCYRSSRDKKKTLDSLDELKRLAETAGAIVRHRLVQEVRKIDPSTYIKSGKVEEILALAQSGDLHVIIFDEDLSPTQNRNLEDVIGVKVLDRTGLILDIFAKRAHTKEGKLQVELAQMKYLLPRLVGKGIHFSRLGGGIGTRGPGETQLEVDRRRARERISRLQQELEGLKRHRKIHREKREAIPLPIVTLVGYTNAGKSTLMKSLTGADVFVADTLFATLDPTVRRLKLPSNREILLTDTVGFVNKLPHQLIEAFHSTFEEVRSSDLLLHVIDISHPLYRQQVTAVEGVLRDLELDSISLIKIYNKMDLFHHEDSPEDPIIGISALKKEGLKNLLLSIDDHLSKNLKQVSLFFPYEDFQPISEIYKNCRVLSRKDLGKGVRLSVEMGEKHLNRYQRFIEGHK